MGKRVMDPRVGTGSCRLVFLVSYPDWQLGKATDQTLEAFLLGNDPLNGDAHVLVVERAGVVKDEFDQANDGEVNEWAKDLGWAWG
ncbi:lipid phosphate phosphatase beta [Pyrus ussuriensis x Pyrus communis]|uniref:Lipid phosphate phosphatase beta n=1 Tax=Pyrus ussuriensis x Pyrus communis TaxID=2448454 RepID=A0A5N5G130_9ROSA|nr:lipid phosphate phosphatase beta [Pyrus ussuriensis x Pyrus communis]